MKWLDALRPWIVPLVALGLLLALVLTWNGSRRARAELQKQIEAAQLERQNLAVAHEATAKELRDEVARQAAEKDALALELERLRKASPGARPVGTLSGTTGALVVPAPPAAPGPSAPAGVAPGGSGDVQAPVPARVCALWAGERLELRTEGVLVRTPAGNMVAVGSASAWVEDRRLVEGPLKLEIQREADTPSPGAGLGIMAGVTDKGWTLGPLLAVPPLHLWGGFQVELVAGFGFGPGGAWSAFVAPIARL